MERPMMLKYASFSVAAAILACVVGISAQEPDRKLASGPGMECSALKAHTFDNTTSILDATLVTGGTLRISDTVTVPNLPGFCRVQGMSKPSADSDIRFEVW